MIRLADRLSSPCRSLVRRSELEHEEHHVEQPSPAVNGRPGVGKETGSDSSSRALSASETGLSIMARPGRCRSLSSTFSPRIDDDEDEWLLLIVVMLSS